MPHISGCASFVAPDWPLAHVSLARIVAVASPEIPMPPAPALSRPLFLLRAALLLSLGAFTVAFIVRSLHWPLVVDSPIMHYVVFLMRHGLRPYSDITDNNMPGAYLTESWAMSLFGPTDLAWRIYEFFLLGTIIVSMVVIARRQNWLAGVYAGGLFLLMHAVEGPDYAAEREEVMTALLLVACAALFTAVRRQRPAFLLLFGVTAALASAIKPTVAPLGLVLLVLALWKRRTGSVRPAPYLAWASAGAGLVALAIVVFLVQHHAFAGFVFTLKTVTPAYAGLNRPNYLHLLGKIFPKSLLPLVAAALLLQNLRQWDWERTCLLLGAAFGALSYLAQGKDYPHHRYTLVAFVLLLCCLEITAALRTRGWPQTVAVAVVLFTIVFTVPHYSRLLREVVDHSDLTLALEQDLRELGGGHPQQTLQDRVQCFDLVAGCLNSLYHLGVVENSAFTGDLLLFSPTDGSLVRYYRTLFWKRATQDPASVLVVSNEWFFGMASFGKLNTFPGFPPYLQANYTEVLDREFPLEDRRAPSNSPGDPPRAYRIYIRKGSPLIQSAEQLGWTP